MADLEFETSALWQAVFGERPKDRQAAARSALKRNFLDLREKVSLLVAQIAKDIPGLMVHDVTHLARCLMGDRKLNRGSEPGH
jgi:hypothetical protein